MPSLKSDIYIIVRVREKSFTIGGVMMPDKRYALKRGRSWSRKIPSATLTDIFSVARKWAVRNA